MTLWTPNRVRFTGFYMSMFPQLGYQCSYTLLRVLMRQFIGFGAQMFQQSCYALPSNWSMDDSCCVSNWVVMGKPTWGTYWVWDARLTTELILLFIYLGLIAVGKWWTIVQKRTELYLSLLCLVLLISLNLFLCGFEHSSSGIFTWCNSSRNGSEIKIGLVICTVGVWLMCSSTILVRAKALLLERE